MFKPTKIYFSDIVIALLFGLVWESLSTDFWRYNVKIAGWSFLHIFPVIMILFWMIVLLLSLFTSESLYKTFFHQTNIPTFDKRLYLIDILCFGIIGTLLELILYSIGGFEYNQELRWRLFPWINLPNNAVVGYFGIGIYLPTMIRYYRKS